MKNLLKNAAILPVIVLAAVAVVVYLVRSGPAMTHEAPHFPRRAVQAITVQKIPFRGRAVAYGTVEPAVMLKAKTEVSGKVSYIHPALKRGGSLPKGTVVLRIEPTTFEFSLDQSKAALAGNRSALSQLKTEQQSTRGSLAIATKNLRVGEKELERLRALLKSGTVSRSIVDAEEQKVLGLRQQKADLQGKLSGYTSRKAASQAQIEQSQSQLAQREDTLGRTEVRLPFDARIGTVFVERGEFAAVGSVLFEALGTRAVEITAQLPTRQFRPLLMGAQASAVHIHSAAALHEALADLNLEVRVALVGAQGQWRGELLRASESIDPTRDTVGLVVAVTDPYGDVIPGQRPPLLKGMYARVEFFAPARPQLVIPTKALHQGRVYVAKPVPGTDAYVLEIRAVRLVHKQDALAVVDAGLRPGDRVITTDVIPVIDGLPLTLVDAPALAAQMAKEALGSPPDAVGGGERDARERAPEGGAQ